MSDLKYGDACFFWDYEEEESNPVRGIYNCVADDGRSKSGAGYSWRYCRKVPDKELTVEQLILKLHKHNDSMNDERSALDARADYNNKLIAMLTMELEK